MGLFGRYIPKDYTSYNPPIKSIREMIEELVDSNKQCLIEINLLKIQIENIKAELRKK